jgi:hypothetical protein
VISPQAYSIPSFASSKKPDCEIMNALL